MSKKLAISTFDYLTNQERAALAFGFVTRGDEANLSVIYSATPRERYLEPSKDFQDRFDSYFMVGVFFSAQFWQNKAGYLGAIGLLLAAKEDDLSAFQKAYDEVRTWESRLLGLELAMRNFCAKEGLMPEDFWRLSDGKQIETINGIPAPDEDYSVDLLGIFEKILGKGALHTAV